MYCLEKIMFIRYTLKGTFQSQWKDTSAFSPAGSLMHFTVQYTKYGKVSVETDF